MKKFIKLFAALSLFLFFTTCSLLDWKKAASDPTVHPKWDLTAAFTLFSKTISMQNYFSGFVITIPSAAGIPIGTEWPAITVPNPIPIPGFSIPINRDVDIGNTGTPNFTIQGIYSTSAKLTLTINLNDGTSNLPIDPGQISLSTGLTPNIINIEGTDYNLNYSYTDSNNNLIYTSSNFLDSSKNYFFATGDNFIDVAGFNFTINNPPALPAYTGGPALTFNCQVDFSLGDFSAVGPIASDIILFQQNNVAIGESIKATTIQDLSNISMECDYESGMPLSVPVHLDLTAAPNPDPVPNFADYLFNHGIFSYDPLNLYYYVSGLNKQALSNTISLIPTLENLNMQVIIKLSATGNLGTDSVRISPRDSIKVKINLKGKGTVGL